MAVRHKRSIHWFRRDLRISDNTALLAASRASEEVIPLYILSDWKKTHLWTGAPRQEFLCGALEALAENLATIAGQLIIRQGEAEKELAKLIQETGAEAIYFNRSPDPLDKPAKDGWRRWRKLLGWPATATPTRSCMNRGKC